MFTIKAVATFALTALTLVACSAGPEGNEEGTGSTESAVKSGGVDSSCSTDSNCNRGLVCDPICPIIPDHDHCEVVGGTCEPVCQRTKTQLEGTTFTSADDAHTITFNADGTFTQHDGCPTTGIHCDNIRLTQGTFSSNGTTVTLLASGGGRNTMSVESHCYEGLVDNSDGIDLYPAPAAAN
jgi:hypothetical protein